DLILLVLILVIFVNQAGIHPIIQHKTAQKLLTTLMFILSFGVGIYTYNYMPVLDFLPYKVGNNIPELMKLPPGAAPDVYEIIYTMKHKQSGETRQISDKEYLRTEIWKDPDWEITGDPESRLVQKGYDVKIKDLRIMDSQGTDY